MRFKSSEVKYFARVIYKKMVHKQHKKYSSYQRRLAPLSCLNKLLNFFLILCITLFIIHLKLPNESRFNSKVLQFMAEFILTYDGRNFLFKQIWLKQDYFCNSFYYIEKFITSQSQNSFQAAMKIKYFKRGNNPWNLFHA